MLDGERTVKSDFEQTDLFALCKQIIDGFFDRIADRAHGDNELFGIRSTVVVEEPVIRADLPVDLLHVAFHNGGNGIIILVAGFACLEEDIRVLCGAAENGVFGVERPFAERLDGIHIAHFFKILVIPYFDLLDLVRGTEAVEEGEERDSALDSRKVSDGTEIHYFLNVGRTEHCKAGLPARHDIGMITENVERVGGKAARGNMDNTGEKLAGDFVHIGDHQKKPLRSGISRGKSARGERTVNGTGSAALRLHLNDLYGLPEDIPATFRRPLICHLCHRGRRSDGVDTGNLGKRIGYMRRSGVAVH